MARKKFKDSDSSVLFITAPDREDLMPKGSMGYIVNKFVDGLDLSQLEASYSDDGSSAYNPRALLKAILLAYCNNVYGCRPIAELIAYDLRYGCFCGYRRPSFNTINRFRTERLGLEGIMSVFSQLVSLLNSEGLIDIQDISIDGTTIESRASRKRIVWAKSQRGRAAVNRERVEGLLEQVGLLQSQDDEDTPGPDSGPDGSPHIAARETEALRKAVDSLPESAAKKELAERLDKADRYRTEDEMCGTRSGTATTDPDSVAMHPKDDVMRKGPCLPMYNAMAASSNQFLVFCGLYGQPNDTSAFPDFLHELHAAYGADLRAATADAAFGSEVNVLLAEQAGLVPYFKHSMYDRERQARYTPDPFQPQNFKWNGDGTLTCPGGRTFRETGQTRETCHGIEQTTTLYRCDSCKWCRLKSQCRKDGKDTPREVKVNKRWWKDTKPRLDDRLDSDIGQRKLRRRPWEIEPCFAHLKWTGNYRRFRHFGRERCLMDLNIKALAVNLKKYRNKAKKSLRSHDFHPTRPFLSPIQTIWRHENRNAQNGAA